MKYARVRVKPNGPWVYMRAADVQDWMNNSDTPSGHHEVEGVQMTPEQFEALPEFQGGPGE